MKGRSTIHSKFCAAVMSMYLLVTVLCTVLIQALLGRQRLTADYNNVLLVMIISGILHITLCLYILRANDLLKPLDHDWKYSAYCIISSMIIITIFSSAASNFAAYMSLETSGIEEGLSDGNTLLAILSLIIIGPVSEELIFRGAFGKIRDRHSFGLWQQFQAYCLR